MGTRCRIFGSHAAAAPATVGGEPSANYATGQPGRRREAKTREPGDLPSPWARASTSDGVHRWRPASEGTDAGVWVAVQCPGVGRESCREMECVYVWNSGVAESFK